MIGALLLLLASDPAHYPVCNQKKADQGVQQEMNICAAADYRAADTALNAQWKITMAKMKMRDSNAADLSFRVAKVQRVKELLTAQRAWIIYRDAHCASEGFRAAGGSLQPLLVSTCKTDLTQDRTAALKALAEEY